MKFVTTLRRGAMEGGYAGGTELAQGDRRKEIADRGTMNLEERKCGVICEVTFSFAQKRLLILS